ncbi:PadR family transcriptional regulator [Candidatus Bathyarchaeota archaeon]|jgi:PadR family transcriptional regulator, regulatory protein PadR|nr:PadR family transcriptional regulator [Candidatus Bathyarchaeota archaeon]MBT4090704.1 PadR family transcriptional regulator [Deltaproteobacteria bacterium]MBT4321169.1 PadR family transcriptional regulator [Candidatus Bathyarchaeota archaeon]MBT4424534.1 PadR family transcriptional regulator [Candidatus Bathyarchaeota archaeon]MBT5641673.1 PadR family transcriptional regulator [Candidatus Bathyarchaeota archaeon]
MSGRAGRGKSGTWIQLLILRILYDSPTHGYEIIKKVNTFQAGRRPIKPGSMYTILRRMEEDGLLESTWDEETARLNRRVYTFSEKGFERLKDGRKMIEEQLTVLTKMKQFYDEHFIEHEIEDEK